MVYPFCIERACPAYETMNFISLAQQILSEIRAVMPSNPGDEGFSGHLDSLTIWFLRIVAIRSVAFRENPYWLADKTFLK
jgi:hypothetical protein